MTYTITLKNDLGRLFPWIAELSGSDDPENDNLIYAQGASATEALQNLIDTYALTVEVGK